MQSKEKGVRAFITGDIRGGEADLSDVGDYTHIRKALIHFLKSTLIKLWNIMQVLAAACWFWVPCHPVVFGY